MFSDYGWQTKTWKLDETSKRDEWIKKHERYFQIEEIFVNNRLAISYKRKIVIGV